MNHPTVVIVPGAWHLPIHYEQLTSRLTASGYPNVIEPLPSVGSSQPAGVTTATDAAFVREKMILPELDKGHDVVVLMHSYGGCPGAAAAKGLSKAEREAAGLKGGIVGLLFMCAFLAQEGDSLLSKLPNQQWEPWQNVNNETNQTSVKTPKETFYTDVKPPSLVDWAIDHLKDQAIPSFTSGSPPPAWPDSFYDGRRGYIVTLQDQAIVTIAQEMMLSGSGVEWDIKKMDTSHSPFLSHPDKLAENVKAIIEGFAKA